MRRPRRERMQWFHRIVVASVIGVPVACSGDGGAGVELPSLRVRASTSGVEVDPDGYQVGIDGAAGRSIDVNGSLEIGGLEDGPHTVELLGVAPNCEIQGSHPRTVVTTYGSTAGIEFEVECRPRIGTVRVSTRTGGEDLDDDGYVVVVDGDARQVGLNASLTFREVAAGSRVVEILGVAPNCSAATQTYHEIDVAGGDTVDVAFVFDCAPRRPQTGSLQVGVTTSGASPDPDGYMVGVDGGIPTSIVSSGTLLLTQLPVGTRSVSLSGIAANCSLSGPNPRPVTISGTELASVAFTVVCSETPSSTGTLRLSTSTSGSDPDPTGYVVRIDGSGGQPVGINATIRIAGLSAGAHMVALEDLTPNCEVAENPRSVTIPANGEVSLTFTVSCIPAFGFIETRTVTTGESIDADGYVARVNGGAGKPISPNGSVTRGGLAPGSHTVQLDNVATNCQVQGDNPRAVVVAGNETTQVTFQAICAATAGNLSVAVTGLPQGVPAAVAVTGPGGYEVAVAGTTTLNGLVPGEYSITALEVAFGGEIYRPGAETQTLTLAAGASLTITVSYSSTPGAAVNLRIAGMYLTQGTQTPDGAVPLVQGRDGYLRVFVVASGDNTATPPVRVRLYRNASVVQTYQVAAPSTSTPTIMQEQLLGASWNVRIPGDLVQPGLGLLAEVDPNGEFRESDESDNSFPLNGTPLQTVVRTTPPLAVNLIPIQLGSGGLIGDVSLGNLSRYLDVTRNMHPVSRVDASLHPVFTSSLTPQQAGGVNAALSTALSELLMLRAVEGSARSYYGVTHRNYSSGGIAGIGYIGGPAAIGWDDPGQAGGTAAHEFGHNWGRYHSPCGNPAGPDPRYPYVGGIIGVFGFDLANERLIGPGVHDLMSYCHPRWISDYTYTGVLAFRGESRAEAAVITGQATQSAVVVWGRVENGRPILEPAFLVDTRSVLPRKPGPYHVEGFDGTGARLFSLPFETVQVADLPERAEHFAFAVPLASSVASGLSRLRLDGPSGAAEVRASALARTAPMSLPEARRVGARVEVRWEAASAPMALVRDATTGEVVAIARGGVLDLATGATELELHLSDGISSQRFTVPVAP